MARITSGPEVYGEERGDTTRLDAVVFVTVAFLMMLMVKGCLES